MGDHAEAWRLEALSAQVVTLARIGDLSRINSNEA